MRQFLIKEGREFKDRLSSLVPKEFKPYEEPVRIMLELTFPNRLRRDIDNFSRFTDRLEGKVPESSGFGEMTH